MYVFILNPVAGRGRSVKIYEEVKNIFDNSNVSYCVWNTTYPGEATILAKKAIDNGYKNIISVGGDGTLLEVVTGLVGSDCNLGIIPAGTGNDFIRSIGIGADHVVAAKTILSGNTSKVDIGSTLNSDYFVNVAGAGFDTEVIKYTEKFKSHLKGQAAYVFGVLSALLRYRNKLMRITIDEEVFEGKFFLIAVANGTTYGGGMKVAPKATPFDGYFDITLFKSISNIKVPFLLPFFIKGRHDKIKQISNIRCKKITIESLADNTPINMDGEIIGNSPMSFTIIDNALNVFVP